MATQTFQHSSFAGGAVRVEFDINDANWRMSQVRCINNSQYPAKATIFLDGAQVFTAIANANKTTSWNTTGVQMGWQPDYYNTITGQWERDGIDMKGYTIQVQYPAGV